MKLVFSSYLCRYDNIIPTQHQIIDEFMLFNIYLRGQYFELFI